MTHEPWNRCPMCEVPMAIDEYRDDDFRIVEYEHKCPNGDYLEQFAYGNHRVAIGEREWKWDFKTPRRDYNRIFDEIQDTIATAIIKANQDVR